MKKFLVVLFTILFMLPVTLLADEEKAKVKVYVFEAGGCPYCEAEHEYLEGLDGYNKTFEVVSKELYVDHVNWALGKDYELGVKVVNAFNKAGYKDASYEGTPLVVISDIYAAATYSDSLEKIINQAYEEGDKDAVSCIENAEDQGYDCVRGASSTSTEKESNAGLVVLIIAGVALVGAVIYIVTGKGNSPLEENDHEDDETQDEDEEDFEEEDEEEEDDDDDDFEDDEEEEKEVVEEKPKKKPATKSSTRNNNSKKTNTYRKTNAPRKTNTNRKSNNKKTVRK